MGRPAKTSRSPRAAASIITRLGRAFSALVTKDEDGEAGYYSTGYFGGILPSATGLGISQYTALAVSTVYACVNIRAKDFARCIPRLMALETSRNDKPNTTHEVAQLLRRPNRLQTWMEFGLQMHTAYLFRGNAYAAKIRNYRGQVIKLLPLNPDTVSVREAPDGTIFYYVSRFGNYQRAELEGLDLAIHEDDILHLRGLSFNSILGVSTLSVARDSVGLALGLEQQAARFMANGARPSGVLQTDKTLSDDVMTRLTKNWESLRAGVHNAGKTVILEEGLKWAPMQLSSVDLEFIEQRKFAVEDVARWFQVPLHKLGMQGHVVQKLDQADQSYVNTTIMPDLDMWEQKLDLSFNLYEQGLKVDFDERRLLRAEEATRVNNQRLKVLTGIMTPNEARAENGDPPMEGGDELMFPTNTAALGSDVTGTAADGAGAPEGGMLPNPGAPNTQQPARIS